MPKHTPAKHFENAFNCPLCNVYAAQEWMGVEIGGSHFKAFYYSRCVHCGGGLLWHEEKIVVPAASTAPLAHEEMPAALKGDFEEARAVFNRSPRSSAALLRLVTQKLCSELGRPGKNLNDDIGALVLRGLPIQVQQALDTVRVIGNNQVHPGTLDVRDNAEVATSLFDLINIIVEVMIAQPKRVDALYQKLPESARKAIEARDAKPAERAGVK